MRVRNKWFKVADELPSHNRLLLIWDKEKGFCVGYYDSFNKTWYKRGHKKKELKNVIEWFDFEMSDNV